MDLPGIGPCSASSYCDLQDRFHMDLLYGTKDCDADEDNDDSIIMSVKRASWSKKCLGTIMGASIMVECLDGPCPSSAKVAEEAVVERRKLDELRHDWVLNHLLGAIGLHF